MDKGKLFFRMFVKVFRHVKDNEMDEQFNTENLLVSKLFYDGRNIQLWIIIICSESKKNFKAIIKIFLSSFRRGCHTSISKYTGIPHLVPRLLALEAWG